MDYDDAFEALIGHEGDYVNHPADPGGETKFGITKRQYPDVDIKNLTLQQAKDIYYNDYWHKAKCPLLPERLRFDVFDTAVNAGPTVAIRLLQRAVGEKEDGQWGPKTAAAVAGADVAQTDRLFNAYRILFLAELKTFPTFGRGWMRRIAWNLIND